MDKKKVKKKVHKTLQPLRNELQLLANEANKRVSQLTGNSIPLMEARRTLPKSRKNAKELFTGNIRNYKDIQKEYARVNTFLSDWRSTKEGDKYYQEEMQGLKKYEGAFGGKWLKKYGETYDISRIDENLATQAFELYHRLTEEYGEDRARMLWNKDTNSKISYGSENMIIALYDKIENDWDPADIMNWAREKMELNYLEMENYLFGEKSNIDYGGLQ